MTVLQTQVQSAKENVSTLNQSISALRKALETAENDYSITSKDLQSQKADTAHQIEQCDKRLNDLTVEVKELQHAENELETKQKSKKREIANIEKSISRSHCLPPNVSMNLSLMRRLTFRRPVKR